MNLQEIHSSVFLNRSSTVCSMLAVLQVICKNRARVSTRCCHRLLHKHLESCCCDTLHKSRLW